MPYWLIKSEPTAYSFDQLRADGHTAWTGVRNNAARLHMRAMAEGDGLLFYHSNEGKQIVGLARVAKGPYPDPTDPTGQWVCMDVAYDQPLKRPLSLAELKADSILKDMEFVRISRLSVAPVRPAEWDRVLELGEVRS